MAASIRDILDDLGGLSRGQDTVSVGDVIDKVGRRGFGALLFVPGLVGLSPLGGIPTLPTLMGIIVVIVAVQVLLGSRSVWMPDMIERGSVSDDRLASAVQRCRRPAQWLDRWFGARLQALTGSVPERIAATCCIVLAAAIPPLELVPFAAAIPLGAIALFGLAILLSDGILMVVAFAGAATAAWFAWSLIPFTG